MMLDNHKDLGLYEPKQSIVLALRDLQVRQMGASIIQDAESGLHNPESMAAAAEPSKIRL